MPKHPRESHSADGLPPGTPRPNAAAFQEIAERELAAANAHADALDARPLLFAAGDDGPVEVVGLHQLEEIEEADTGEHEPVKPAG